MRWLTILVAPVLAVGCGLGDDEAAVEPGNAERLVLQRADVPDFRLGSSGGGPERWTVRYRRASEAPMGVESKVEVRGTSEEAGDHFDRIRETLDDRDVEWQPIGEPGLGDESFAFTRVREAARSYEVVWRDANVTGHLSVSGVEGKLAFADVLALAEKQEQRIENAKS